MASVSARPESLMTCMESEIPCAMAARIAAIPTPAKRLASASASAALILRNFSLSPFSTAASLSRLWALISFMALATDSSTLMPVISTLRISQPYLFMAFCTEVKISATIYSFAS
eukprot:Skav215789  [mRNA]  locus=scaffold3885:21523:22124:- [translate_table: standard]